MEGVDYLLCLLIMVPITFLVIAGASTFDPGVTHEYTGHIVDVQYSAGAYGHADMTIVYFTDRTIIFNSRTEINRDVNATICWSESSFRDGKKISFIYYEG
jgi:hypothetical protein